MKELLFFNAGFEIKEVSERKEKGVPVGILAGYLATWDIDRGKDRFIKGAFQESLAEHRNKNRMIRMKYNHYEIIGGFPIETVYEDEKGLYVEGHINLETQLGRETYALAKQGVITDFSIGYSVQESEYNNGIRDIIKATIWEGSAVYEPMNEAARINEVKSINNRANMPKKWAPLSYMWDADAAIKRLENAPQGMKADAVYIDEAKSFLIADYTDGEIKLIPRAVIVARAIIAGARGGVDLPAESMAQIKRLINSLYGELGIIEPFTHEGKSKAYCTTELKHMQRSILFDVVRFGELSKNATAQLIDAVNSGAALKTADEVKEAAENAAIQEIKKLFTGVK